jgi:hypothetical protein
MGSGGPDMMRTILTWFDVFLIIGGIIITLAGLVWDKSVPLLYYIGIYADPDTGFKVILAGFAMLLVGVGVLYLMR